VAGGSGSIVIGGAIDAVASATTVMPGQLIRSLAGTKIDHRIFRDVTLSVCVAPAIEYVEYF